MSHKTTKDRYFVLSIAKNSLVQNYPKKYQEDTGKYPIFQLYLDREDDKIFLVHESEINNIECELDFLDTETLFECGDIANIVVERVDSADMADVVIDKYSGQPVGTERDRRNREKPVINTLQPLVHNPHLF